MKSVKMSVQLPAVWGANFFSRSLKSSDCAEIGLLPFSPVHGGEGLGMRGFACLAPNPGRTPRIYLYLTTTRGLAQSSKTAALEL